MFGNGENLKDSTKKSLTDSVSVSVPYGNSHIHNYSYPKLPKLITALYIVTDIIEKSEPIRTKLRTLGTDILSDTGVLSRSELKDKIQGILSLLDIGLTIQLISEMNCNILKKEFILFHESISEINPKVSTSSQTWLEEFLAEPVEELAQNTISPKLPSQPENSQKLSTYIGVNTISDNHFFILKKQRRADIIQAIKDNGGKATITEVKLKATPELAACGEKTLQRELVSMVKDNILNKTGEKRWSRYSLKTNDTIVSNNVPL